MSTATCEICGRPVEGEGLFAEAHVDPAHFDDCYRIGYEREKARADDLAAPSAAESALNDIAAALGCAQWDYPGQVVRDVWQLTKARPLDEWHEDYGSVLWWCFPVCEPPYCGSPLGDDFPDYVTHWTPFHVPEVPTP